MLEYLFNKVTRQKAERPATLLKRDSNTGVLTVNIAKFFKKVFFIEHLWWLLLYPFYVVLERLIQDPVKQKL